MGTDVSSDWKEGSTITYNGEYKGKKYHDKGIIKKIEPEKILQSNYFSSLSEKEHSTENWKTVVKKLKEVVESEKG